MQSEWFSSCGEPGAVALVSSWCLIVDHWLISVRVALPILAVVVCEGAQCVGPLHISIDAMARTRLIGTPLVVVVSLQLQLIVAFGLGFGLGRWRPGGCC